MRVLNLRSALGLVLLSLAAASAPLGAADGHIDPAARAHRHSLTFARHAATSFHLSTAIDGLRISSEGIQACDSQATADQDVACQVTLGTSGSLGTFGQTNDGNDVILTQQDYNEVVAASSAYVKVVTMMSWCGRTGNFLGCAPRPGTGAIIVALSRSDDTGQVLFHEFGHNKGLCHRGDPACAGSFPSAGNPLMDPFANASYLEVNQAECAALHAGGTDNGPKRAADIGFIVDDTGSMSEEIGGVRDALTRAIDAAAAGPTFNAFRLTTFKDSVSHREPTTDLSRIRADVSNLVAFGGGDCPEASVEAILAAEPSIKDNGRAFIFTDASPYEGANLADAVSKLRARGIRIDALLTGDCVASGSSEGSLAAAVSTNGEGADATQEPAIKAGPLSAVEAFSNLATQTGGSFIFQPGVNSGISSDVTRFENTVFNLVQGALTQAITSVEPAVGPRGGLLAITLRGSKTNFRSTSALNVGGTGVNVQSIDVVSPVELRAVLQVAAGASLGFRDVEVRTGLGGDVVEVARGVGALEITTAPSGPRIVGISPSVAAQGSTVEVKVSGRNTNFSMGSLLSLGTGISVQSIVSVSANLLTARVRIAGNAPIGFRDVRVTTGTQNAIEFDTGPFFVSSPGPEIPRITQVTPGTASPGTEVTVTIDGQNTHFAAGLSHVSVSGDGVQVLSETVVNSTRLRATLYLTAEATAGFRDVRVITGSEVAAILSGFLVTPNTAPCVPGADRLCLTGDRFEVGLTWMNRDGQTGSGSAVPFGSDSSGLLWFFSAANWEMLIKVLDACSLNQRFWVFAAATTDVEYRLTVRDTRTGQVKTYFNPIGGAAHALTDTDAFATCDAGSSASADTVAPHVPLDPSVLAGLGLVPAGDEVADLLTTPDQATAACTSTATQLCLNSNRFRVEVIWTDPAGNRGPARVVPVASPDSGLLWFFSSDNWEMLVKVLNGCSINNNYWVFSAATTNVAYTLRVTDTTTGRVREYSNPQGRPAAALTDTGAFPSCP